MLVGARALAWSSRAPTRMPGWNLSGDVEAMSPDMVSQTSPISAYVTLLERIHHQNHIIRTTSITTMFTFRVRHLHP